MQVLFLVLCTQHVHDFAILRSASRTFSFTLSIAFKAVLVEGMAAQEMNWWQLQGAIAHVTLGLLEYFGAVWKYSIIGKIHIHTKTFHHQGFYKPSAVTSGSEGCSNKWVEHLEMANVCPGYPKVNTMPCPILHVTHLLLSSWISERRWAVSSRYWRILRSSSSICWLSVCSLLMR